MNLIYLISLLLIAIQIVCSEGKNLKSVVQKLKDEYGLNYEKSQVKKIRKQAGKPPRPEDDNFENANFSEKNHDCFDRNPWCFWWAIFYGCEGTFEDAMTYYCTRMCFKCGHEDEK